MLVVKHAAWGGGISFRCHRGDTLFDLPLLESVCITFDPSVDAVLSCVKPKGLVASSHASWEYHLEMSVLKLYERMKT